MQTPLPHPAPIKPVVILPDTSPLVHLAAADALHVLNDFGRVVVVDVVALEATFDTSKPFASAITAWIEQGSRPGANRPVEVAETELGPLYRLVLEQNVRPPRNAGEIGITEWLAEELHRIDGPALVVCENSRIPGMLAREGIAGTVAVAITRNLLELAERDGILPSAEEVAIRRYSAGEISAMKAADLLGHKATVADVFLLTRQAGLPLPRPPREQEAAELPHALQVLDIRERSPTNPSVP